LPLEELKGVPPRAAHALLEVLLEKDPARRFQNPTELLKVEGHFINVYFSLGGNPSAEPLFFVNLWVVAEVMS
jgi:hypothetical protein